MTSPRPRLRRDYHRTCATCGVPFTARGWDARYCPACRGAAAINAAAANRKRNGSGSCAELAMPQPEAESRMDWQALQEVLPRFRRGPWPGSVQRARVEMERLRRELEEARA